MAQNFIWWKNPEEGAQNLIDLICRVMTLGTWEDVQELQEAVGEQKFRQALSHAPPGIFDERSWNYWHYRFGILPIPPLPKRSL